MTSNIEVITKMPFDIRPGPWPRDLTHLKELIERELVNGPKKWSEFEQNRTIMVNARSTSTLSRALKELIQEKRITQKIISHKNRPYILSKDNELILKKIEVEKTLLKIRSTLGKINDIEENKSKNNVKFISSISASILIYLINTIFDVNKSNIKSDSHFSWLIENVYSTLFDILITCYKLYPDSSLESKNELNETLKQFNIQNLEEKSPLSMLYQINNMVLGLIDFER